jgi:peptidoglycan LD-endopeptidase CwlK
MRNRFYDPQTGRFTQEDPSGIAGGLNLYGFAGGDPVTFSDPYGLCVCDAKEKKIQKVSPNDSSSAGDRNNQREIKTLDPAVQPAAAAFMIAADAEDMHLRITQGYRSFSEQDRLYAQGRTTPGQIVTYARAGQSYHNYGLAIDVYEVQHGRILWGGPRQATIGSIGKGAGFEWGGDWSVGKQDRPHFQITGGLSWQELYAQHAQK